MKSFALIHIIILTSGLLKTVFSTEDEEVYQVKCDHTTPVCECPLLNDENGKEIDVCEFQLQISAVQSFVRYAVNTTNDLVGLTGDLWIIDDEGNFRPQKNQSETMSMCGNDVNSNNCTEPFTVDGYTFRYFIAINNRIPGPTLIVNHGQTVSVLLTNNLQSEVISIHWHGLDQKNTNFMDGVEHVTQCGAPPGSSFHYIFEGVQTGTYWYHSHTGTQRTDGLFGALIFKESDSFKQEVEEQEGVNEFVDSPDLHTLVLIDWQEHSSLELFSRLVAGARFFEETKVPEADEMAYATTSSPDGADVGPVPFWSALINGKGRYQDVPYIQSRLSIFTVSTSTQYRFRLVGAQGLFAFRVSIDGHRLKLIALDGTFIKPRTVDFIIIHAGERYDFLLETKSVEELDDSVDFAIRAETLEDLESGVYHEAEGILHYDHVAQEPRSSEYEDIFNNSLRVSTNCTVDTDRRCEAVNCPFKIYPPSFNIDCIPISDLELLFPLDDSDLPDVNVPEIDQLFFNFAFDGSSRKAAINGRTHVQPSSPLTVLDQDQLSTVRDAEFCTGINTNSTCDGNFDLVANPECVCTHVRYLGYNRSIQMVFSTVSSSRLFPHPVHLHGHQFQVVDIQFGEYDDNGILIGADDSIVCGGENVCTNPRWREGRDYGHNKTGKISNTAPRKDTLFLPANGHAVVYFKSNNPGFWFVHCHIEVHQIQGMSLIISEAQNERLPTPEGMDQCGNFSWTLDEFNSYINGEISPITEQEDDTCKDEEATVITLGVVLAVVVIISVIVILILIILLYQYCKK